MAGSGRQGMWQAGFRHVIHHLPDIILCGEEHEECKRDDDIRKKIYRREGGVNITYAAKDMIL